MDSKKSLAIKLIIIFGIVSLFGDIIYEGTRGVTGPYLKILGANALIVGFIAGFGEFMGYLFRLFSGYFSDKTGAYWFFTFIGYSMIAFIPLLSIANMWQIAGFFIIMERIGKALRSPARDTIISHLTKRVGSGFAFGLHELLDQIGGVIGPLIFTFTLLNREASVGDYKITFAFMWIPFIFLIFALFFAYFFSGKIEKEEEKYVAKKGLPRIFLLYTIFTFITTFGFISFAISGYHFKAKNIFQDYQIPLMYAFAMAVDGIAAIFIGKTYDRMNKKGSGLRLLLVIPFLTLFSSILIFSNFKLLIVIGVILWGIVMGAHETIMRAGISDITLANQRGTAYGIFNFSYGVAFFLGASLAGFLYEYSVNALIIVIVLIQIFAMIFFLAQIEKAKLQTYYLHR
ncbi:MAG: MFS transporter [Thermoplasmatales archaeon]|nr:MFS transporter [Thermoplasmatales archaeon]